MTHHRYATPFFPVRHALILALGLATAGSSAATAAMTADGKPFPMVELPILMEHVITPAAYDIWHASGYIIDKDGMHDLAPKTDEEWEEVVNGAATLIEAGNLLMIEERVLDDDWPGYVRKLTDIAEEAFAAAEAHDQKKIDDVSDRLDGICTACHQHYGLE